MSEIVDVLVPDLPESVSDATVAVWHKKIGDNVQLDDILVEIETDKIMLEIPSSQSGLLKEILAKEGSIVVAKQLLGRLLCEDIQSNIVQEKNIDLKDQTQEKSKLFVKSAHPDINKTNENNNEESNHFKNMLYDQNDISSNISKDNKIIKEMQKEVDYKNMQKCIDQQQEISIFEPTCSLTYDRKEKRIPMTRLRKKIAERLVAVKKCTAMLTTFNEINMKPIIDVRKKYAESFEKNHGVKLGFMSFYVKAVLEALKRFPEINASIDNENIVYYSYFDINIAVSTDRGLVTPILRNIGNMSIVDIEKYIKCIVDKSRNTKLKVEDLDSGNFTITNGGVFGSLLSTPIINPPQSAILGMHVIKDRPVVINKQILVLPMMYVALSYDHRLIDGKDSIKFLITIKDMLEDPIRLFLKI